ncbi:hypothetical protein AB0H71_13965 [Nocardia sp. NPDC050697]|uniref:hypothetical protein n=1 Tax=Nocardia sp. NPDC050697 TaxID=3155158 RepID=UPI0033C35BFE
MTRAELEAYALSLGWAVNKTTTHPAVTLFGRDGYGIAVIWHHAYPDEVVAAALAGPGKPETWAGFGHGWVRKRLRELAATYTPPASLLDTVAVAVDDEPPDLADLPTVEGEDCTHEIYEHGRCAGCGELDDPDPEMTTRPSGRVSGCQGRGWYHDGSEEEAAGAIGRPARACPECSRGGA